MIEHNFKIGDKVKLKYPKQWSMGTATGVVVGFDGYIRVTWDSDVREEDYPHYSREIEHVVKKGEQLLFNFME